MSFSYQPNPFEQKRTQNWHQWLTQLMAILISVNCVLCLFDLSYLPLRSVYLHYVPFVTERYDSVKGVEPHAVTQRYLKSVDDLSASLSQPDAQPSSLASQLRSLQQQSVDLINENPFSETDHDQDFGKLKRLIRARTDTESAQVGASTLWDESYLDRVGWSEALQYFDQTLRPLLNRTYYREIDENGWFIDRFWQWDRYFMLVFGIDFLIRTYSISRSRPELNWGDAIFRRWYDWLLFLPTWRWLRLIPAAVRLNQSNVLNVDRIIAQATHEPTAYFSDRVAKFLLVRLVNQIQETINEGDLTELWSKSENYVQLGQENKVDRIADQLLRLTIYNVLPEVQPETEALLKHSIRGALHQSDFLKGVTLIPGIGELPAEAIEQISGYLSVAMYQVLADSYADDEAKQILEGFTDRFKGVLQRELKADATQSELKGLLTNLLEEVKVNYIQRTNQRDPKQTMSEVDQLNQDH